MDAIFVIKFLKLLNSLNKHSLIFRLEFIVLYVLDLILHIINRNQVQVILLVLYLNHYTSSNLLQTNTIYSFNFVFQLIK
jgi:hypothetical protein